MGESALEGSAAQPERRNPARPLRIVVADDDRDLTDTLSALLRTEGHHVYAVQNGRDVLPAVRMLRPDALILDLTVPGMSGFAVAQEVRHSFLDVRRPLLIAMSGFWKDASDKLIARQVGFDHYLEKPCPPSDLLRILTSISG